MMLFVLSIKNEKPNDLYFYFVYKEIWVIDQFLHLISQTLTKNYKF